MSNQWNLECADAELLFTGYSQVVGIHRPYDYLLNSGKKLSADEMRKAAKNKSKSYVIHMVTPDKLSHSQVKQIENLLKESGSNAPLNSDLGTGRGQFYVLAKRARKIVGFAVMTWRNERMIEASDEDRFGIFEFSSIAIAKNHQNLYLGTMLTKARFLAFLKMRELAMTGNMNLVMKDEKFKYGANAGKPVSQDFLLSVISNLSGLLLRSNVENMNWMEGFEKSVRAAITEAELEELAPNTAAMSLLNNHVGEVGFHFGDLLGEGKDVGLVAPVLYSSNGERFVQKAREIWALGDKGFSAEVYGALKDAVGFTGQTMKLPDAETTGRIPLSQFEHLDYAKVLAGLGYEFFEDDDDAFDRIFEMLEAGGTGIVSYPPIHMEFPLFVVGETQQ